MYVVKKTRRRRLICAALVAVAAAGAPPALAQAPRERAAESGQTRDFDIAPQPLSGALIAFGRQSGLQVSAETSLTQGLSSPGAKGRLDAAQALAALLSGTGLTYRVNGSMVALERAPRAVDAGQAVQLGAVQVEGDTARAALDPTTEKSGTYAAHAATVGSRVPEALQEIPNSISVVTRQQMDDRNVTTMQDALRYVTGAEAIDYGDGTAYFRARGNQLGIEFDGVPLVSGLQYQPQFDLGLYDRVEVLRGPSGSMDGANEPGGTVNLVRKRAGESFALGTETQADSFGSIRQMVDVTGPLNETGTLRGRAVVIGADGWESVDGINNRKGTGYVALDADLGPDTLLSLSGAWQAQELDGFDYGAGGVANSTFTALTGRVPGAYTQNFSPSWNNSYTGMEEANADLLHHFDNGWDSHTTLFYRHLSSRAGYAYSGPAATAQGLAYYGDQRQLDSYDWFAADTNVSGPIHLFGQTHTLTLGADYSVMNDKAESGFVSLDGPYPGGLFNLFDPNSVPNVDVPLTFGSKDRTEQYGVYGQARIHLAEPLALVLGARVTYFRESSESILPTVTDWTTSAELKHRFLPSAGIVWDIVPDLTAYANFTKFLAAQTATTYTGSGLPPRSGQQYEAGLKGALFDGKLTATAAAFHIDDDHRAVEDPLHPTGDIDGGKARDQGFEVEIAGQPLPNWNLSAGYTYLDVQYDNDTPDLTDGTDPRHLFKLWTDYRFAGGMLDGFSVGGGMLAQTAISRGVQQGGYAIFNTQVGYRFAEHVTASLQVNNLFDRSYYIRPPSTFYSQFGDRRNAMLTIRTSF